MKQRPVSPAELRELASKEAAHAIMFRRQGLALRDRGHRMTARICARHASIRSRALLRWARDLEAKLA